MDGVRTPGPLRRLVRGHGMVRSPLRRTTHRVEAALTALVAVLALVAIPVAASIATGVYERGLQDATRTAAERQQVEAVLLGDPVVHPTSRNDGIPGATATVSWRMPTGEQFTQKLRVDPDLHAGETVRIWSDAQGNRTTPPKSPGDVLTAALIIGIDLTVLGWLLLGGFWWLGCRVLDRVNAMWWDIQWARTGPRWSRQTWQ